MGLLDDAIREHLELKRRRGADPSEVARQQHEALDPEFDEPAAGEHEAPLPDDGEHDDHQPEAEHEAPADGERQAGHAIDLAPAGQETAEIDMRSVLEAADDPATGVSPAANVPPAGHHEAGREDDSFAWEMPGDHEAEQPPAEIPGQERLTFE
jgi:hypothetical protein